MKRQHWNMRLSCLRDFSHPVCLIEELKTEQDIQDVDSRIYRMIAKFSVGFS
jgi:hypothetical protein